MKNDRMHELYASACLYAREQQLDLTDKNVPAFVECMAEKFAELIVNECVIQCEREWIRHGADSAHNQAIHGCINSIKKHFGVEE